MKKIFVTGASGFIGSHIVEKLLLNNNNKVIAFDKYNSFDHWGNLEHLKEKFSNNLSFIFGDVRDFDLIKSSMKGCDSVLHLAALIGIPYSYNTPLGYIKTNIEGTYNILEASKENKVKSLIVTSTSEVYGNSQYEPMDEAHPIVSQSPYSASKTSADNLSISYFRSFKLPVKIIRPFNTFGPRQSQRAIIPTIIMQAMNSNIISIGNINAKRDFTYVEDLVNAFIKLDKFKGLYGDVVNIGTGESQKITDIIKKIEKMMNIKLKIKIDKKRIRPKNSEINNLICNYAKAKKLINWKPKIKFDQGLQKYYDWLKQNKINKKNTSIYHV